MPSKIITDAFVKNLTWQSALREFWKAHNLRNAKRKAAGQPEKEIKPPVSISYLDRLERGLSLELVISYGGAKSWRMLTYQNAKPISRGLGSYPAMPLKEARAEARARWENPKKYEDQDAVGTFKQVAENWLKRVVKPANLKSGPKLEGMLKTFIYPKWEHKQFLEIRRREVIELLDHIVDTPRKRGGRSNDGRSQADAVLAVLRLIMTWHQSRDEDYISPIVKGMRRAKPNARKRVLTDDEIRALWNAEVHSSFGAITKILLLSGQRVEKVEWMKWADLSDDGVWTIPKAANEKGVGGPFKLPAAALEIIKAQPRLAGNEFVFAGKGTNKPFNSRSQRKGELDVEMKKAIPDMAPWRIHDLRRTARTLLARIGVGEETAEAVLGHTKAGIVGVYNRYDYFEEQTDALKRLAGMIEMILNPTDNVVQLKSHV